MLSLNKDCLISLKRARQLLKTYEKSKDKNKVKGRTRVFAKVIVKFIVKDNDRIKDPKLNLSVCKQFKYLFKYKYG